MNHVMIDLETLGTGGRAAMIELGACAFDPIEGLIGETFEARINWDDALRNGTATGDTLRWWMKQPDESRLRVVGGAKLRLKDACERFAAWAPSAPFVWGHGPTFDLAILAHAYQRAGVAVLWSYRGERCVRTIMALEPSIECERFGVGHSGVGDAVSQAIQVIRIYKAIGRGKGWTDKKSREITDRLAADDLEDLA